MLIKFQLVSYSMQLTWIPLAFSHVCPICSCFVYMYFLHLSEIICCISWRILLEQIKSLLGTKVEWLYYILESFNSGNLVRYQELCRIHSASLSAQPALVENEKKLLEKINILCLMEIIFRYFLHIIMIYHLLTLCQSFIMWTEMFFLPVDHQKIELFPWASLQTAQNLL